MKHRCQENSTDRRRSKRLAMTTGILMCITAATVQGQLSGNNPSDQGSGAAISLEINPGQPILGDTGQICYQSSERGYLTLWNLGTSGTVGHVIQSGLLQHEPGGRFGQPVEAHQRHCFPVTFSGQPGREQLIAIWTRYLNNQPVTRQSTNPGEFDYLVNNLNNHPVYDWRVTRREFQVLASSGQAPASTGQSGYTPPYQGNGTPLFEAAQEGSQDSRQAVGVLEEIRRNPETVRARLVMVSNQDELQRSVYKSAPGGRELMLNLFPDVTVPLGGERFKSSRSGDYLLDQEDTDQLTEVVMLSDGRNIGASISRGDKSYSVVSLGGGAHIVVEKDLSRLPPDHPPEHERRLRNQGHSTFRGQNLRSAPEVDNTLPNSPVVVRTLVAYTPAAQRETGNIEELIKLAVAETNTGYRKSKVNVVLRVTRMLPVDYRESDDLSKDLDRLEGRNDGQMDSLHQLRDQTSSDIVVLVTKKSNYCGIAADIFANQEKAFAVVAQNCATGYYSFGHEVGHLLGARHDPKVDDSSTPYPFAHGNLKNSWRTIMAYGNYCNGCKRINRWSSPHVTYRKETTGAEHTNHNARALNISAPIISGFR